MTAGGQNSWGLNKAGDKESPPQVSTRAAEHREWGWGTIQGVLGEGEGPHERRTPSFRLFGGVLCSHWSMT